MGRLTFGGSRASFRGVVTMVGTIHGHHTRVGMPPSGGTGIYVTAASGTAFRDNGTCVYHLTCTDRMRINGGFSSSNSIHIVASGMAICVPVGRLISFATRVRHLGGSLSGTRISGRFFRGGLGGTNFVTGTPTTLMRRRGTKLRGTLSGVRVVGNSVGSVRSRV